jgi:TRAP-type C4-dicarboxylate transport system permease small subunit
VRNVLAKASERLAALGGFALVGAMLVTLYSVIGARFGKPLLGDTEIVELLVGVAIACFMPYCHLRGSNVIVDFFTMRATDRTKHALDALMNLVFAVIIVVLTWRLTEGAYDQFTRGRASMFLQLPQWWGFAGAAVACLLWSVVSLYSAVEHIQRALVPARAAGSQ